MQVREKITKETGKEPGIEEIAKELNCSAQHVYDQRYQALKKLRLELAKEGDEK